jgi:cytochrome c-type biogenesis protein CcmF
VIALVGEFALGAAALAAAWSILACVGAWKLDAPTWIVRARRGLIATCLAFLLAGAALALALANTDLRLDYVAAHSERALPLPLRLAAFWSGQEGSLLLWAMLLTAAASLASISRRRFADRAEAVTLGAFAACNAFFAALLLFAADPFTLVASVPLDGYGLQPQLRHWAMVAHPPMLFTGYALFSVPFAIALGAMAARRTDNDWVGQMRPWALLAWIFLGAGIALGAYWAYAELGWGGYWAWDPVENASLMPWLTGTALVHTIAVHHHRGMLKAWTPGLACASFILCVFGTYITRSGVIQSVHAFGQSTVGNYFASFLALLIITSACVLWRARRSLAADARLDALLGREGMTLMGNVLLSVMAVATLLGTISPLLSSFFTDRPRSAGPAFYNRVVVPAAIAAAALMALAPLLAYGRDAARVLRRGMMLPGALALAALVAAVIAGIRNPTALICTAVAAVAIAAILLGYGRAVIAHARRTGAGLLPTAARVVDANHRRYGGQIAHLGVIIIILGVTGSSLFSVQRSASLKPGDHLAIGRYTLRYDSLEEIVTPEYTGVRALISLARPGAPDAVLSPERRFYDRSRETSAEVAIRSSWREDLYIALVGWEDVEGTIAIQVHVNPLTAWIWAGSIGMVLGGALCLLPRLLPRAAPRTARAPLSVPTSPCSHAAAHP